MGRLNVPNSSVIYDNPKQQDQSTLTFPPGFVTPAYPPNINGTLAGQVWQPNGPTTFPQPGTFDTTPPQANPIAVNQDPPVPGKGQPVAVQGSASSTGVPTTDLNRRVSGTVPGTNCTFRNPA
jgi:hypothetical protein